MNLHQWGLEGVQAPSWDFEGAMRRLDARDRLLANAPTLASLIASDPENRGQEIAKTELLAVLDVAVGWMR